MSAAIVLENVSKRYRRHEPDRPQTLQEMALHVLRGNFRALAAQEWFWALQDINLSLEWGTMTGLIGSNGAGKSTLLRLIGGVGYPDRGLLSVNGRIGALIDLGAGFHPDLTGRENVIINGVISGLTRREVLQRFDEIVQFAGLEAFIDSPLRTYSTGMHMRLAFSVAVHCEPQILLIDEVLAVGDLAFQEKCLERIAGFKQEGCAIVLVSHDAGLVGRMCDRALWLKAGKMHLYGPAPEITEAYSTAMRNETRRVTPGETAPSTLPDGTLLRLNENRFGSQEVQITSVRLLDEQGAPATDMAGGAPLRVQLTYHANRPVDAPTFGVTILRSGGMVCSDLHWSTAEQDLLRLDGEGEITLNIERLDLAEGSYHVDVGVYREDWSYAYDYHSGVYPLCVSGTTRQRGVLSPPVKWDIIQK